MATKGEKRPYTLLITWDNETDANGDVISLGDVCTIVARDNTGDKPKPLEGYTPRTFRMSELTEMRKGLATQSGLGKRVQDDTALEAEGRKPLDVIKARMAKVDDMIAFLKDGGDNWDRGSGPRFSDTDKILIAAAVQAGWFPDEKASRAAVATFSGPERSQLLTDRQGTLWPFIKKLMEEKTQHVSTQTLEQKLQALRDKQGK